MSDVHGVTRGNTSPDVDHSSNIIIGNTQVDGTHINNEDRDYDNGCHDGNSYSYIDSAIGIDASGDQSSDTTDDNQQAHSSNETA